MNGAEAKRVAILITALEEIDVFSSEAAESKPDGRYNRHILDMSFGNDCDSGMDTDCSLAIDATTGLKLIPIVRKLIVDELKGLGVTL